MTVLDPLAPDQRAVVGLVLQQGKSYREIADLLGISRSAVRARAHAGLAALAPTEAEVPADEAAQLSDFLLGQQDEAGQAATRELIDDSTDARMWATAVAERLREVAPERVPAVGAAGAPAPAPRPRPTREPAAAAPAAPRPPLRSSKLGGILLIAVAALVVAVVLVLVLRGGDDTPSGSASNGTPAPTATATATATPRVVGQIALAGSSAAQKAKGTMTLFLVGQQLGFQIEGQDVPPNSGQDRYAVWFVGPGNKADLIGVARDAVASNGALGVSGPPTENATKFPQQLAAHRRVVVSRETSAGAKKPGPVVLSGKLPSTSG
jgi:sigma-70-like protein